MSEWSTISNIYCVFLCTQVERVAAAARETAMAAEVSKAVSNQASQFPRESFRNGAHWKVMHPSVVFDRLIERSRERAALASRGGRESLLSWNLPLSDPISTESAPLVHSPDLQEANARGSKDSRHWKDLLENQLKSALDVMRKQPSPSL